MDSLEGSLLNHRLALAAYMEEWSKQQEHILSKYAFATNDAAHQRGGGPEEVAHTMQNNRPIAEESWGLFSEQKICGETPPEGEPASAAENMATAEENMVMAEDANPGMGSEGAVPAVPSAASLQRPSDISASQGIATVLQEPKKSSSAMSLFAPRLSLSSVAEGSPLKDMLESSWFGFAISAVILSNVIFMAIAADRVLATAQRGLRQTDTDINVGEIIFTCIYVIELALKLVCYGRRFFFGSEWQWHLFDMAVVLAALVDILAPLFLGSTINVSYLRVNRLIKLVKMLRVVTIYRTFKELRLIIASVLGCVKTMFWVIALLSTVLFTFALIFVQAVTEYVKETDSTTWNEEVLRYWGSTRAAMITLFQSSTGGEDWAKVADPLWNLSGWYYGAFMLYICFFMFIVVNILTALFVDAALGRSMKDDSLMIQEEIQNKQEYITLLKALYRRLDQDGSNALTWEDFEKGLHHPHMMAFASALEIEISDVHEFFRLISSDGRHLVDLDSFVVGCMKLRGSAKSLDVVSLIHTARNLENFATAFATRADGHLEEVKRLVSRVLSEQERRNGAAFGRERQQDMERVGGKSLIERGGRAGGILHSSIIPSQRRLSLLAPDSAVPCPTTAVP